MRIWGGIEVKSLDRHDVADKLGSSRDGFALGKNDHLQSFCLNRITCLRPGGVDGVFKADRQRGELRQYLRFSRQGRRYSANGNVGDAESKCPEDGDKSGPHLRSSLRKIPTSR